VSEAKKRSLVSLRDTILPPLAIKTPVQGVFFMVAIYLLKLKFLKNLLDMLLKVIYIPVCMFNLKDLKIEKNKRRSF